MDAKYFTSQALPNNQPSLVIHIGSWLEMLKIDYQLKSDDTWPSSGDSCSTKWLAFREMLKTG